MNLSPISQRGAHLLSGVGSAFAVSVAQGAVDADFDASTELSSPTSTNAVVPIELQAGPDRVPDWVFAVGMFAVFVAIGLITVLLRSRQRTR